MDKDNQELEVKRVHYEDGSASVWAKHPLIPELAQGLATFFDDNDAANYVEVRVQAPDGRTFALTLQLVGNLTPHDKVLATEVEIERLQRKLYTMTGLSDWMREGYPEDEYNAIWRKFEQEGGGE